MPYRQLASYFSWEVSLNMFEKCSNTTCVFEACFPERSGRRSAGVQLVRKLSGKLEPDRAYNATRRYGIPHTTTCFELIEAISTPLNSPALQSFHLWDAVPTWSGCFNSSSVQSESATCSSYKSVFLTICLVDEGRCLTGCEACRNEVVAESCQRSSRSPQNI